MSKLQITSDKIQQIKISLNKTKQEIAKFETKYHFSSDQFIDSCTAEDLNEEIDYICWMGELKIKQSLVNELQILQEEIYKK